MRWRSALALLAVAGVLGIGVHLLREATQSTHYRTSPSSKLRIVVEARSNRAEPTQGLAELTEAHLGYCRVEISSNQVGEVEALGGDPGRERFAVVLQPALDSTDRKQYEGCLEDWTLDHHLMHVVSMDDLGPPPPPEGDDG